MASTTTVATDIRFKVEDLQTELTCDEPGYVALTFKKRIRASIMNWVYDRLREFDEWIHNFCGDDTANRSNAPGHDNLAYESKTVGSHCRW